MSLADILNRQYVVVSRGGVDSCKVIQDRDVGTYLHARLCACDATPLTCDDESVQAMMKRLSDPDEWSGDCFEFEIPSPDGESITVFRLDERAKDEPRPLEIQWEGYSGEPFNPQFSGYTVAPYFTGAPELGWSLYSRGAGGCWVQRTKRQYAPFEGWQPKRIAGRRFWTHPNAEPKGSVLTNHANCNA